MMRLRLPLLVLFGLLLTAVLTPTHLTTAAPHQQPGLFTPSDCFFETGIDLFSPALLGYECGYVTVPATHANPDGPTMRLPVAIVRAQGPRTLPDPLFVAQGGPGGSAFAAFALVVNGSSANLLRDIVIFNQRGTLYAEPDLLCEEVFAIRPQILSTLDYDYANELGDQAFADCYQRLQTAENIDLSAFDSLENAADIDYIRQALGYDMYNFYGISYGTLLGLHLMNSKPPGLRSVILDGVVPTQTNFITESPQSENRAYDELFRACNEDAVCRADYPNLEARLFAHYELLNEMPIAIDMTDDETGEQITAAIDGDTLRGIMFQMFYIPGFYAVFPRLVSDMEAGNYQFIKAIYPLIAFDRTLSDGMYYSVICAEDADYSRDDINLAGIRPFIADSVMTELDGFADDCDIWQVEPLPASIDEPVQSEIPTLLLSGRFDPITPPKFAATAAATLPNSTHIIDPAGSHGVAFGESSCINQIVAAFLMNPKVPPNDACIAQTELATILPDDVVLLPLLQGVNQLDTATIVQLGLLGLSLVGVLSAYFLWPLVWIIRKLQNSSDTAAKQNRRARISGRLLLLSFGFWAFLFMVLLFYFVVQAIGNSPYLLYSALESRARPIFALPLLLILLYLGSLLLLLQAWRDSSTGGRFYNGFLLLCSTVFVLLLFTLNLITPLFS